MERHFDPLVGIFVVHVVDDVHRSDVNAGEPLHRRFEAVEDVVELEVIPLHRLRDRRDLLARHLVAAAVDCIEQAFGEVGASAEELHLLAHQHG